MIETSVRHGGQVIDLVAVERVIAGDRDIVLTEAEREYAARELVARGGTCTTLARALRYSGARARAIHATLTQEATPA